jgi:hypothetical protein
VTHVNAFGVAIGLMLLLGAGIGLRQLARFAREGEVHLVMNGAGDGLFGQVVRSERPLLFWLVWMANLVLIAGVTISLLVFVVFA